MKSFYAILFLLFIQFSVAQTIEAKAKSLNQYAIVPNAAPVLVGATSSENFYIFNLDEKLAFENPKENSEQKIKIRQFQKLENGNYKIDIENDNGKKDIQLLVDFINKKLIFYLEVDSQTQMEMEYLLEELTIKN